MKTKVSLQAKILNVLELNRNGENRFLTAEDIASKIYGRELFINKTAKFRAMQDELISSVKNAMGFARQLGDENGFPPIIALRKETKDKRRKCRIIGWKIFTPGDKDYLIEELEYKKENGQARVNSFNRLKETTENRKLLSLKEIKQIAIHNSVL